MRPALYARVSTDDKGQDPETQLVQLQQAVGDAATRTYVDRASAANLRGRAEWRQLLDDCRRGLVQTIYITKIDRAWRSLAQMSADLEHLDRWGVELVVTTQPIDTRGPTGRLVRNILGAVAEFERELIAERTREGLDRARQQGKRLGRPKGSQDKQPRRRGGYYARA